MDAQADLSLRWEHTHFVGFVMSWLIYRSGFQMLLKRVAWPSGLSVMQQSPVQYPGPTKLPEPLEQKNLHPVCPELEKVDQGESW